jgi:hypothetical protein
MKLICIIFLNIFLLIVNFTIVSGYETEPLASIYQRTDLPVETYKHWDYLLSEGAEEAPKDAFDKNTVPNPDEFYKVYYDPDGSYVLKVEKYLGEGNITSLAIYVYGDKSHKRSKILHLEQVHDCVKKKPIFKVKDQQEFKYTDKYIRVSRFRLTSCRELSLMSIIYYKYSWKKIKEVQLQGDNKSWETFYTKSGRKKRVIHYNEKYPVSYSFFNKKGQMTKRQLYFRSSDRIKVIEKYKYDDNNKIIKIKYFSPKKLSKIVKYKRDKNGSISEETGMIYNINGKLVKKYVKAFSGTTYYDINNNVLSAEEYEKIS